ncbi:MAG TPA: hypothetical protein PLH25_06775 [Flavobacterium sp.]|nr:hypothetical protein [Flavobacterium sp.]
MIFKKQLSILIAFFVLVSNSGLAFNVHFCEGKIASVTSVFSEEEVCVKPVEVEKSCCAKAEPTHEKCCSDKEVNLKNKVEKIIIKTIAFDMNTAFYFTEYKTPQFGFYQSQIPAPIVAYYCDANAPPFYKLYCQLTFYA